MYKPVELCEEVCVLNISGSKKKREKKKKLVLTLDDLYLICSKCLQILFHLVFVGNWLTFVYFLKEFKDTLKVHFR